MPVRIEDVARHAGVSMKTVSRVLNNEPNVRQETRRKVNAAVSALDYRPNPSARSLAGNRSYLIGLLYGAVAPAYLFNVQSGVLKACNEANYGLVLHPCVNTGEALAAEIEAFVQHSCVDGLILTPPVSDNGHLIAALKKAETAFVRISPMDHEAGATVSIDERRAAAEIMEHLISLGHRRIAFIRGPADHGASQWRFESYKTSLAKVGIDLDSELIEEGDFSYESGVNAARALLSLKNPPTAIFASNDDMAAGVLHVAHDQGIPVPDSLSVAGFDDTPLASQIWPDLTTVHQPMKGLGAAAADQLLEIVRSRQPAADAVAQEILEYSMKIRGSTGPAPHRS